MEHRPHQRNHETQSFVVRIPRPLHRKVQARARRDGISMAEVVRRSLRDHMA